MICYNSVTIEVSEELPYRTGNTIFMRYIMFSIIVGSAVGFLCSLSILSAVSFLVVRNQRKKQAKRFEASLNDLRLMNDRGDN